MGLKEGLEYDAAKVPIAGECTEGSDESRRIVASSRRRIILWMEEVAHHEVAMQRRSQSTPKTWAPTP